MIPSSLLEIELDWILILSLIFGGCCSNAYYLELSTKTLPSCGTILTISQFFFTALLNLNSQLYLKGESKQTKEEQQQQQQQDDKGQRGQDGANKSFNGNSKHHKDGETEIKENIKPGMRVSQMRKRNQKSRYLSDTPTPTTSTSTSLQPSSPSSQSSISNFQLVSLLLFSPLQLKRLRWKKPIVPISRWSIQVVLYLTTSLLNNTAFAYQIPMAVHIIFRSGGLVVNMALGWAVGRKYTPLQIFSVLLVTFGVSLATLSTTPSDSGDSRDSNSLFPPYTIGVLLLTLALILSGLMGLYQEKTYEKYGSKNWREGLFYSHALSLPLFLFRKNALSKEWGQAARSRKIRLGWGRHSSNPFEYDQVQIQTQKRTSGEELSPLLKNWDLKNFLWNLTSFIPIFQSLNPFKEKETASFSSSNHDYSITLPLIIPLLLLNVLTQLLCINGVNRLTSRVTSLTVTLILVVRKALSLAISVVLVGGGKGNLQLWSGAAAVVAGTVGYSLGGNTKTEKKDKNEDEDEDKDKDEIMAKVQRRMGGQEVDKMGNHIGEDEDEDQDDDPWSKAGRSLQNEKQR